jgi:uncharacterized spore protein YtfJ
MSLNKLFDTIEQAREMATWQAAFGEPQDIGDQTIIPVATVSYGFGLGFGGPAGTEETEEEPCCAGEGGGGGGGASTRPLGALVVTPDEVYFEETADAEKIIVLGMLVGALAIWQFAKTLRAILGKS